MKFTNSLLNQLMNNLNTHNKKQLIQKRDNITCQNQKQLKPSHLQVLLLQHLLLLLSLTLMTLTHLQ